MKALLLQVAAAARLGAVARQAHVVEEERPRATFCGAHGVASPAPWASGSPRAAPRSRRPRRAGVATASGSPAPVRSEGHGRRARGTTIAAARGVHCRARRRRAPARAGRGPCGRAHLGIARNTVWPGRGRWRRCPCRRPSSRSAGRRRRPAHSGSVAPHMQPGAPALLTVMSLPASERPQVDRDLLRGRVELGERARPRGWTSRTRPSPPRPGRPCSRCCRVWTKKALSRAR